jgi:hypothetical protein
MRARRGYGRGFVPRPEQIAREAASRVEITGGVRSCGRPTDLANRSLAGSSAVDTATAV